jgi:hypothetical protein
MDSKASVIVVSPTKLMSIYYTKQVVVVPIDWSRPSWPASGSPLNPRWNMRNGVGDVAFH